VHPKVGIFGERIQSWVGLREPISGYGAMVRIRLALVARNCPLYGRTGSSPTCDILRRGVRGPRVFHAHVNTILTDGRTNTFVPEFHWV